MSIFEDILKMSLPVILATAQKLADAAVDGATLSADLKGVLYEAYVVIQIHGEKLVDSTDNPYDNEGLDALAEFAADTLLEAGIEVPEIPAAVFEEPEKEEDEEDGQ